MQRLLGGEAQVGDLRSASDRCFAMCPPAVSTVPLSHRQYAARLQYPGGPLRCPDDGSTRHLARLSAPTSGGAVTTAIRTHGLATSGRRDRPRLTPTPLLLERYGVGLDVSANCVVVAAGGARTRTGRLHGLATDRADVNGVVRRRLTRARLRSRRWTCRRRDGHGVRRHHRDRAAGGLVLLVDERVDTTDRVIIGSGVRRSSLVVPGALLGQRPGRGGHSFRSLTILTSDAVGTILTSDGVGPSSLPTQSDHPHFRRSRTIPPILTSDAVGPCPPARRRRSAGPVR